MTVGEMARFVNGEYGIGADLTVVEAEGWTRSRWYDATGMEWLAPSPNMPDLEAATHYPGTCLFEGVNVSVGRGTPDAFKQIGAPWLDAAEVVRRLDGHAIAGVRFEATTFTPSKPADGKYDGVAVNGIRFIVTDRATYDPTRAALLVLQEIRAVHATQVEFNVRHFDRLAGTDRVRLGIEAGTPIEQITAEWPAQVTAFESRRSPYLIYR
jgi:uncharacterized protein YbbC (DUF1343 family)